MLVRSSRHPTNCSSVFDVSSIAGDYYIVFDRPADPRHRCCRRNSLVGHQQANLGGRTDHFGVPELPRRNGRWTLPEVTSITASGGTPGCREVGSRKCSSMHPRSRRTGHPARLSLAVPPPDEHAGQPKQCRRVGSPSVPRVRVLSPRLGRHDRLGVLARVSIPRLLPRLAPLACTRLPVVPTRPGARERPPGDAVGCRRSIHPQLGRCRSAAA